VIHSIESQTRLYRTCVWWHQTQLKAHRSESKFCLEDICRVSIRVYNK
jgi:hypothetical protein